MPDHLSYSQVSMMGRCPRQFEFRYLKGIIRPPSGALVLGSAFHKAVEHNYRQKVTSGEDAPADELTDVFRDDLKARCAEGVEWDEDESEADLADSGAGLVEVFREDIMRTVQPVLVEERYELDLIDGIKFVAILDCQDSNGIVRDNKTAKRATNQADVDKDMQLTTYAVVRRLVTNEPEKGLAYDQAVKTKTPKTLSFRTSRTEDQCVWQVEMIRQVARQIESGIFPPNPNGWHCSEKFCGYWKECHTQAAMPLCWSRGGEEEEDCPI